MASQVTPASRMWLPWLSTIHVPEVVRGPGGDEGGHVPASWGAGGDATEPPTGEWVNPAATRTLSRPTGAPFAAPEPAIEAADSRARMQVTPRKRRIRTTQITYSRQVQRQSA